MLVDSLESRDCATLKVLKAHFEAKFDGLVRDENDIANEFVDWESAGTIFSFDGLRNALFG